MRAVLYTDGSSRPNPGTSGVGVVLYSHYGEILDKHHEPIGYAGSNKAEYEALKIGLQRAKKLGVNEICCKTDSKNLVNHFTNWRRMPNSSPELKRLINEIKVIAKEFDTFNLIHIPRKNNLEADKMSRLSAILPDHHEYSSYKTAEMAANQTMDSMGE